MSFSFMNFIIYAIVYVLVTPILTVLHELGHAIPALIFTKSTVSIDIGGANLNKKIKVGRLLININGYRHVMEVSYGYVKRESMDSKIKSIIVIGGGPFVSLLISLLVFILSSNLELSNLLQTALSAVFTFSFINFIMTILPMKYNYYPYVGFTSDGYKILECIKMKDIN